MSSTSKSSRSMDWIIFFISLAVCIGFLMIKPEWFWVTLPFLFTYLVKAMDLM